FVSWAGSEPALSSYCVKADTNDEFKWVTEPCSTSLPYMCEITEGQCRLRDKQDMAITSSLLSQATNTPHSCTRSCFLDSNCFWAMYNTIFYYCDFVNSGTTPTLGPVTFGEEVYEKVCPVCRQNGFCLHDGKCNEPYNFTTDSFDIGPCFCQPGYTGEQCETDMSTDEPTTTTEITTQDPTTPTEMTTQDPATTTEVTT
ncbi:unnamed protein product, partial [Owenia fusiformis]